MKKPRDTNSRSLLYAFAAGLIDWGVTSGSAAARKPTTATSPGRMFERIDWAVNGGWTVLLDRVEEVSPWLLVGIYAVLYAALLLGATVAAVTLGTVLPHPLGALVFFTVGLGLIAAAPVAARGFFTRAVEAVGASGEQRRR